VYIVYGSSRHTENNRYDSCLSKIARNAIEDTERLVTEIEMLKVVLYLVSKSRI
jgi:hypothetical protein